MENFEGVKRLFKREIVEIVQNGMNDKIKEAALPSYAHQNPLIDYIFWKRLKLVYNYTLLRKNARVVDFGCGPGIMSYALARRKVDIIAIDTEFGPLDEIRQRIDFPTNIRFHNCDISETDLKENSIDLIIALDVLEHIQQLDPYIQLFRRILRNGGEVIVSGPTENLFYQIGRRIAGKDFTGEYHVANISRVKQVFEQGFDTRTIGRLMWPVTLFEIFVATPKSRSTI